MRRKLLIFFFLFSSFSTLGFASAVRGPTEAEVEEFNRLINDHRIKLGLRPLEPSPVIEEVALEHSQNMARFRNMSHLGFSLRCSRLHRELGPGLSCGENVAKGQPDAVTVFEAWYNSPSHRVNIEDPNFTHAGLGVYVDGRGVPYWTHIFFAID